MVVEMTYANGSKSPQSSFDGCLDGFPQEGCEGLEGTSKLPSIGIFPGVDNATDGKGACEGGFIIP